MAVFAVATRESLDFIPYPEQLKMNQWKDRRLQILKRDNNKCKFCGKSDTLNIHHKYYIRKRYAWMYPDEALVTLCEDCHFKVHGVSDIVVYGNAEKKEILTLTPCTRCGGSGFLPQHRNIQGGICFRCWGARYEELIPKSKLSGSYGQKWNLVSTIAGKIIPLEDFCKIFGELTLRYCDTLGFTTLSCIDSEGIETFINFPEDEFDLSLVDFSKSIQEIKDALEKNYSKLKILKGSPSNGIISYTLMDDWDKSGEIREDLKKCKDEQDFGYLINYELDPLITPCDWRLRYGGKLLLLTYETYERRRFHNVIIDDSINWESMRPDDYLENADKYTLVGPVGVTDEDRQIYDIEVLDIFMYYLLKPKNKL